MLLEKIDCPLTVAKVVDYSAVDLSRPFTFTGATDGERSLVCPTADVPNQTVAREDGWRAFRIGGELDFGLVGILAAIAALLADAKISIFAISTFNTDYVLVKEADFDRALGILSDAGYQVV